jgi:succinoglycan exporter
MALLVRYLLDTFGPLMPNPVLQIFVGAALGGVIYAIFVVLSERPLLTKIYELVKNRRQRSEVGNTGA